MGLLAKLTIFKALHSLWGKMEKDAKRPNIKVKI